SRRSLIATTWKTRAGDGDWARVGHSPSMAVTKSLRRLSHQQERISRETAPRVQTKRQRQYRNDCLAAHSKGRTAVRREGQGRGAPTRQENGTPFIIPNRCTNRRFFIGLSSANECCCNDYNNDHNFLTNLSLGQGL